MGVLTAFASLQEVQHLICKHQASKEGHQSKAPLCMEDLQSSEAALTMKLETMCITTEAHLQVRVHLLGKHLTVCNLSTLVSAAHFFVPSTPGL